jgi:hypothetical protein
VKFRVATFALAVAVTAGALAARPAQGWDRTISFQGKQDLFYNYYEGPNPSGTATAMYISPRPVPPVVGHTYTTYQPLMPHEYLYKHTRSHYAHVPGAGWSRAKVRYRTYGLRLDHMFWKLSGDTY